MQCKSPIGVLAQTSKVETCSFERAAQCRRVSLGFPQWFCAPMLNSSRAVCSAETIGVLAKMSKAENLLV